jgi:hypothetical protein
LNVTLTMPTGEPESKFADHIVADHIEIRVRDSRIDAGEYGANEYPLGMLYISSQTNELRFWASMRLTAGMEARYANVPLTNGLTIPSEWLWPEKTKWLWRTRMMRRMLRLSTPSGKWLCRKRHMRRTRMLTRVKGTR